MNARAGGNALPRRHLAGDVGLVEPGDAERSEPSCMTASAPRTPSEPHLADGEHGRHDGLRCARRLELRYSADIGEVVEAAREEGDGAGGVGDAKLLELRDRGLPDAGEAREG